MKWISSLSVWRKPGILVSAIGGLLPDRRRNAVSLFLIDPNAEYPMNAATATAYTAAWIDLALGAGRSAFFFLFIPQSSVTSAECTMMLIQYLDRSYRLITKMFYWPARATRGLKCHEILLRGFNETRFYMQIDFAFWSMAVDDVPGFTLVAGNLIFFLKRKIF